MTFTRLRSWLRIARLALRVSLIVIRLFVLPAAAVRRNDPTVRLLVAALLAPLVAALFAMLFVFLLRATGRGLQLRPRQTAVMVAAACIVVVFLLPVGGPVGSWLASAASWTQQVPLAGVFRGLLIGVAVLTAVQAARILLAVDGADD